MRPPAPLPSVPLPAPPGFDPRTPSPWGPPSARAVLKQTPEDFRVEERLHVRPCGEGEHLWLRVRKRGINTEQAARRLAKAAGVPVRRIAHAGLKDRQAVAEQWFSLHLPGDTAPDALLRALSSPELTVLEACRHHRRLRPGALAGNRFRIRLRRIEGDRDAVVERLALIARGGMPNYFGPQRFGRGHANWHEGLRLLRGELRRLDRHRRGLYLSALRSHLFNRVLAARVETATWNRCLPGELLQLDGRTACFTARDCDADLQIRLERGEIHPTGPLPGRPDREPEDAAAAIETRVLAPFLPVVEGLAACGVASGRRALRARIEGFIATPLGARDLEVAFSLPPGAYATVFLGLAVALVSNQASPSRE